MHVHYFPLITLHTYKQAVDETMPENLIDETILETNSIIDTLNMAIEKEEELHEEDLSNLWQLLV